MTAATPVPLRDYWDDDADDYYSPESRAEREWEAVRDEAVSAEPVWVGA